MHRYRSSQFVLVGLLLAGPAPAVTTTTLGVVDFESPAFTTGPIGGNPLFSAGQGGWGHYNPGSISSAEAHSGTQALQSVYAGQFSSAGATKALDAANDGEYPQLGSGSFNIGYASDWWVQAWVRVSSGGGGARLGLVNGLGGCPQLEISGTGGVHFNNCFQGAPQPGQGANVLDQWILIRLVHTTSMFQSLEISIIGDNVNFSSLEGYGGPNGSSAEQYITLSGDAYWDDVSAGYGSAPAVVPIPAAGWLLASAFGVLLGNRRQDRGRRA